LHILRVNLKSGALKINKMKYNILIFNRLTIATFSKKGVKQQFWENLIAFLKKYSKNKGKTEQKLSLEAFKTMLILAVENLIQVAKQC
jgi:hypothetical protein